MILFCYKTISTAIGVVRHAERTSFLVPHGFFGGKEEETHETYCMPCSSNHNARRNGGRPGIARHYPGKRERFHGWRTTCLAMARRRFAAGLECFTTGWMAIRCTPVPDSRR